MKELEIVTTCQVTQIVKVSDETAAAQEHLTEQQLREAADAMKESLNADKVDIIDRKVFIHDMKEGAQEDE